MYKLNEGVNIGTIAKYMGCDHINEYCGDEQCTSNHAFYYIRVNLISKSVS